MASVPISKAYVEKLTKATDMNKPKDGGIQVKAGEQVKSRTKPFNRHICCKGNIAAACCEKADRINTDP